nr:venom gland protein U7-PHTX-Pmx1c [Physocyclus mexicanus]
MKKFAFFAFFVAMIVCSLALQEAIEEKRETKNQLRKIDHPLRRLARYIGTNNTSCLKPGAACSKDSKPCCAYCFECVCGENGCSCRDTCGSGRR